MWAEKKFPTAVEILSFLMILSLFATYSRHNFLELFDLYWFYPVYAVVVGYGAIKLGLKKLFAHRFSVFLLGISAVSLVSMWIYPYSFLQWGKQVGGWTFFGYAWIAIILLQRQTRNLLKIYMGIALVAAFLTIPEQILHLNGIHLTPMKGGWLGLYRCYSIADEPFPLALLIVPCIIYYMEKGKSLLPREKIYLLILFIGLFFTFSGAGWLTIGLYFVFSLFVKSSNQNRLLRLGVFIVFVASFTLYHGTRLRISETLSVFSYFPEMPNEQVLNATNTSSRAIYLNMISAWEQVRRNPLIGGGLGSHGEAYERVVTQTLAEKQITIVHYNQLDGASGAIRWLSEMGLLGIFLFLLFMQKIFQHKQKDLIAPAYGYWTCFLLHAGNYFQFGSLLWLLLMGFEEKKSEAEALKATEKRGIGELNSLT